MNARALQSARLLALVAFVGLTTTASIAGQMDLIWDPVAAPDLAGYRVFYDTVSNSYQNSVDVGNVNQYSLTGLSDCTFYYTAVKAIDTGGLLSTAYSNEVSGYAHPEVVTVTPSTLALGETAQIVINGASFAPGASVEIPNVTIDSTTVDSCGQITSQVTVLQSATSSASVTVVNTDLSFGTKPAALQITGGSTQFSITSVSPTAGTTDVDADATIQVVFSNSVDPRTITPSRFKVLRAAGGSAKLEPGSPTLDASGTTVTLRIAGMLQAGETYTVLVKGGKSGVVDTGGAQLPVAFTQSPGFTTAPLYERTYHGPSGSVPDPQLLDPLDPQEVIPINSMLVLKFAETMSSTTVNAANFKLVAKGKKLRLKNGVPSLSADGLSVIVETELPLPAGAAVTLSIKGGSKGAKSTRGVPMKTGSIRLSFSTEVEGVQGLGVAD